MSIATDIESAINKWKEKGLIPSTLLVGADIAQQLREELGQLPAEYMGLKVAAHYENGFSCTGPWYYSSKQ